jgi:hypothetical protein
LTLTDLHTPEVAFKGLCYAIKLKLEFAVLSKLVEVAGGRKSHRKIADALESARSDDETDLSRTHSNPAFVVDPSRRAATQKVKAPNSLPGSDRSDWVEDLEKVDSASVGINASTTYEDILRFGRENSLRNPVDASAHEHKTIMEKAQHRRVRRESDDYANMMRELAKPG